MSAREDAGPGDAGPGDVEPSAVEAAAAALGAQDVLFFRRVRPGEWLHTGGVGRGAGWAGLVVDDEEREPLLQQALASGASVRVLSGSPTRVVGPFLAGTAVLLALPPDGATAAPAVAVWGHPARSERLPAASDEQLLTASSALLAALRRQGGATPTQRLSDELEVLHAVQEVTAAIDQPLARALERVASVVAAATGAQVAAAWVDRSRSALVTRGWEPPTPDEEVVEAAASAAPAPGSAPLVVQDAGSAPLPSPLAPEQGVRSYLLAPLDAGPGGGVLVARAGPEGPQGFDDLAQRVVVQVARAAGALVSVALARTQVEEQLSATRLRLGQDALTEAASRHRWDEEVAHAQQLVDSGVPVTVALLDLDDLKEVNDTRGHPAGDALLQACARAVRGVLRGGSDVVARVGGDEFAVLVAQATDTAALAARLRSVDGTATPVGPLRVSVGLAQCPPGGSVAAAFAEADAAMYTEKRRRREESR